MGIRVLRTAPLAFHLLLTPDYTTMVEPSPLLEHADGHPSQLSRTTSHAVRAIPRARHSNNGEMLAKVASLSCHPSSYPESNSPSALDAISTPPYTTTAKQRSATSLLRSIAPDPTTLSMSPPSGTSDVAQAIPRSWVQQAQFVTPPQPLASPVVPKVSSVGSVIATRSAHFTPTPRYTSYAAAVAQDQCRFTAHGPQASAEVIFHPRSTFQARIGIGGASSTTDENEHVDQTETSDGYEHQFCAIEHY